MKILELRDAWLQYRELSDKLPIMIFESNLNGKITYANPEFYSSFGYTKEDLNKGIRLDKLVDIEDTKKDFKKLLKGKKQELTPYKAL